MEPLLGDLLHALKQRQRTGKPVWDSGSTSGLTFAFSRFTTCLSREFSSSNNISSLVLYLDFLVPMKTVHKYLGKTRQPSTPVLPAALLGRESYLDHPPTSQAQRWKEHRSPGKFLVLGDVVSSSGCSRVPRSESSTFVKSRLVSSCSLFSRVTVTISRGLCFHLASCLGIMGYVVQGNEILELW